MTLRKIFIPIVAALAMLVGTTACNSDSDEGTQVPTYVNIVTLKDYTSTGMIMEYQAGQFSPVVTLTCDQKADTGVVKLGQRFLILYNLPIGMEDGQSGPINLMAYQKILNGKPNVVDMEKYQNWNNTPAQITELFMTGNYLNVSAMMPTSANMDNFKLLADSASMENETAELYLYIPTNSFDMGFTANRIGTFNLTEMMAKYRNVRRINIHSPNKYETSIIDLYKEINPTPQN